MDTIEKELIGAIIRQPKLIDTFHDFIFSEGVLQSEFCKKLIQALKYLRFKGIEIDSAILKSHIETIEGSTDEVKIFFLEIDKKTESTNFNYILALLLLRKKKNETNALGELLINIDSENPEEFNSSLLEIFNKFERIVSEEIKGLSPFHFESLSNYLTELSNKKSNSLSTGFIELDKIYGGFNWNEFIVIGGRPGMGKSTLAFNIALHTALTNKIPTAIISLDYSEQTCYAKLLSNLTEIPFHKFIHKKFNNEDIYKISDASTLLTNNNLIVTAPIHATLKNIVYKINYLKREHDVKLIVIDFLQLMDSESNRYNREQVISSISRKLKELSRSLSITIIATSQLSRAVESRGGDKRPQLSDLRDSGSLEQDADSVWFVYRPEYYGIIEDEIGNSTSGIVDIIIAKNKSGACDVAQLNFIYSVPTFKNLVPSVANEPEEIKTTWDLSNTRTDEFN